MTAVCAFNLLAKPNLTLAFYPGKRIGDLCFVLSFQVRQIKGKEGERETACIGDSN